jgi:radical SAM protein with 4Fe4S-binding SPASM domain
MGQVRTSCGSSTAASAGLRETRAEGRLLQKTAPSGSVAPLLDERHPDFAGIQQRRAEAHARSSFPAPQEALAEPAQPGESIWWCDFLWNRTYVTVGGDVRPCCVFGVPVTGNLLQQPFEQVWNNDAHRVMRQRMVAKKPVTACRGCMHIKKIDDPAEIGRLLQGRRVPRADEFEALPAVLDPRRQPRHRSGTPPVLEWEEEGDAVIVRKAGRYTSEEIHRAIFRKEAPASKKVEEFDRGVRRYMKKKHARR